MIGERTGASSQSPWLLASRGGIDGHPCTTNAPNRVKGGSGRKIAFFGSSLLSAYWNGAATYYRGILRALAALGLDTGSAHARTPVTHSHHVYRLLLENKQP